MTTACIKMWSHDQRAKSLIKEQHDPKRATIFSRPKLRSSKHTKRQSKNNGEHMACNRNPKRSPACGDGDDENADVVAKWRKQMQRTVPSLRTSFRVDGDAGQMEQMQLSMCRAYGTEQPAEGDGNQLSDMQQACVTFHNSMQNLVEECRQRASQRDLL